MNEELLLTEWSKEVDIDRDRIIFKGYTDLRENNWQGVTRFIGDKCSIELSYKLKGKDLRAQGVLWHEFCHAWNHIKQEGTMHDKAWSKKLWSKPILAIWSYIAKITYGN